ncbi:hypothetical protein ACHWQZ_G008980 [Mnemiopsis leidyi]
MECWIWRGAFTQPVLLFCLAELTTKEYYLFSDAQHTRSSGIKLKHKAPEPKKDSTAEQKRTKDNEFCTSVLKIPSSDIEVCWRAGKLYESKPDYCRPLVIKLKDEALVKEWTKEGKGHRTESGH